MKTKFTRRNILATLGGALTGVLSLAVVRKARAAVQKVLVSTSAPKDYEPSKHKWLMAIDINRCIGCALCVEACKTENSVPRGPTYFRTWIERYIIKKPARGSDELMGEVVVDSPNGGLGTEQQHHSFPPTQVPREEILKSFYVPKLCNLCEHSPCTQACPVGATFDAPDGAVLIDPNYCVGCGFCIQACPYGCRFMTPDTAETRALGTANTAQKCSLCYHRITRGLKPACVEVCPTQARIFGDLKNPVENDPLQKFIAQNKVEVLKPHLGTSPRVLYAGMDKEVR